jgi:hypothetical protein
LNALRHSINLSEICNKNYRNTLKNLAENSTCLFVSNSRERVPQRERERVRRLLEGERVGERERERERESVVLSSSNGASSHESAPGFTRDKKKNRNRVTQKNQLKTGRLNL